MVAVERGDTIRHPENKITVCQWEHAAGSSPQQNRGNKRVDEGGIRFVEIEVGAVCSKPADNAEGNKKVPNPDGTAPATKMLKLPVLEIRDPIKKKRAQLAK